MTEVNRRRFLVALGGTVIGTTGFLALERYEAGLRESVLIAKAASYEANLRAIIESGLRELGITPEEVRGKRILLKPNLVEPHRESAHINTHPLIVQAVSESFRALGAQSVLVAEGPGHQRDIVQVLEASGLYDVLKSERLPFQDLNHDAVFRVENEASFSRLPYLMLPSTLRQVDWIVSIAKMKTHHWAGCTLTMKNLFGVMPGSVYGWPKNVLHQANLNACIVDIAAAVRPHFAIVDGIVGMEGDGPIMGTPKQAGVIVMGRNAIAVDATAARVMGINPHRVPFLRAAGKRFGPIYAANIEQRGEPIEAVRTDFQLLDFIPAQRGLRLS